MHRDALLEWHQWEQAIYGGWEPVCREEVSKLTNRVQKTNETIKYNKITTNKDLMPVGISKEDAMFHKKATTKAIKSSNYSSNYRYELEKFKKLNSFLVEAKIESKSTKHVDSMFGGYKVKTMLLKDIKIVLRDPRDKKLKVVGKLDHIWINEEENTIVRDKNNEVGDIVRFYGNIKEYTYSHGKLQLGIGQAKPWHKNRTQGHEYSRCK